MRRSPSFRMALITGASSGIGQAFAEELPERTGLMLVARNAVRLEELGRRLARPGRRIIALPADLTTDAGRNLVIEQAGRQGIDLLINNAGRGQLGRLIDHALEDERATVELNVMTPLVLTRALLPGMLAEARAAGRRAAVIVVASEAAFAPLPYFATYAASKAFDLVLAESLAEELRGEPVDVLALCPGATRTEFGQRAGFAPGSWPGAVAPRTVAREALRALGRHRVLVSGRLRRATLVPITAPRALAARAFGCLIGLAVRLQRRPDAPEPRGRRLQRSTMPQ